MLAATLAPVADDARVAEQPGLVPRPVGGDDRRVEPVEGAAKSVAFPEDGQPGEASLEPLQGQPLEELLVIMAGDAPLLVVIGDVERIGTGPGAAGTLFGVGRSSHRCSP